MASKSTDDSGARMVITYFSVTFRGERDVKYLSCESSILRMNQGLVIVLDMQERVHLVIPMERFISAEYTYND